MSTKITIFYSEDYIEINGPIFTLGGRKNNFLYNIAKFLNNHAIENTIKNRINHNNHSISFDVDKNIFDKIELSLRKEK